MAHSAVEVHWHDGHAANADGKLQCPRCPRSFKRPEHLKRHERSHDGPRRFSCSVCDKKFARSDILARHSSTHNSLTQASGADSPGSGAYRKRRACLECARAREKCTRAAPCMRCSARSLECVYPDRPLQGQPPQAARQDAAEEADDATLPYSSTFSNPLLEQTQIDTGLGTPPGVDSFPVSHGNEVSPTFPSELVAGGTFVDTQATPSHDARFPTQDVANTYAVAGLEFQQDRQPRPPVQFYCSEAPVSGPDGFIYTPSAYDASLGFPMNWLPANDAIDVDYSSILGLAMAPPDIQTGSDGSSYNNSIGTRPNVMAVPSGQDPGDPYPPRPAASPAETSSTLSHSSIRSVPLPPSATKGGLYATSTNGARAPCTVRARRADPSVHIHNCHLLPPITEGPDLPDPGNGAFSFPDLGYISFDDMENHSDGRNMQTSLYETVRGSFRRLCLSPSPLHKSFISADFPSIEHLNFFISLYFDHFATSLPIIHVPSFDINGYWPLTLAMAAIGCQYTQTKEFWNCVAPLHEFLRRALLTEQENRAEAANDNASFVQALILSQVGMLYCGSSHFQALAKRRHGELVGLIKFEGLLRACHDGSRGQLSEAGGPGRRAEWLAEEIRRRLGYAIWLLDCMMAYHFRVDASLSLEAAQSDLPHDGLWSKQQDFQWDDLYRKTDRNPSLFSAVQQIFTEKQVKSDLGEFSRVILLHGVYREVFQIKDYFKRPLSSWVPSAQPLHGANQEGQKHKDGNKTKWLANGSIFSSWRNAAMDCVDTLHWAANATIALLSGAEHPTVMHLHLARVVLCVPYDDVMTLALSVGTPRGTAIAKSTPTREEAMAAEHEVLHWAQRDQSKARLAALHSGCLYWHIRRYSTMAFYESVSVFLATLSLWAYSYYTSRATAQQRRAPGEGDPRSGSASREQSPDATGGAPLDENAQLDPGPSPPASRTSQSRHGRTSPRTSTYTADPDPTFIRLDRPNDDEMVQLFVRSANMRAYITGVGDICAADGPARILREGRKILGTVSVAWGRTREYHDILEAMEQATMTRANDERVGLQAVA